MCTDVYLQGSSVGNEKITGSCLPAGVKAVFQISTWKVLFIKNKFLMKNLTDFRKTVETGVDPGLSTLNLHTRSAPRLRMTAQFLESCTKFSFQIT